MLSKQRQLNLPIWDCKSAMKFTFTPAQQQFPMVVFIWNCFYLELPYSLKQGLLLSFPDPLAASNRLIFGSAASVIIFLEYPLFSATWHNWCLHYGALPP